MGNLGSLCTPCRHSNQPDVSHIRAQRGRTIHWMQCVGLNQSADHEAIHLAMHLGMRKHAGIALGPWPDALARRKFQKQRREQVDRKGRACYHMYLLDVSCCTGGLRAAVTTPRVRRHMLYMVKTRSRRVIFRHPTGAREYLLPLYTSTIKLSYELMHPRQALSAGPCANLDSILMQLPATICTRL